MVIRKINVGLDDIVDFSPAMGRPDAVFNTFQLMCYLRVDEIVNVTESLIRVLSAQELTSEGAVTLAMSNKFFYYLCHGLARDNSGNYMYPGARLLSKYVGCEMSTFRRETSCISDTLGCIILGIKVIQTLSGDDYNRASDDLNRNIDVILPCLKRYLEGLKVMNRGSSYAKWVKRGKVAVR